MMSLPCLQPSLPSRRPFVGWDLDNAIVVGDAIGETAVCFAQVRPDCITPTILLAIAGQLCQNNVSYIFLSARFAQSGNCMDSSIFLKNFQAAFNKSELRGLCFDLGFDPENIERQEKDEFARNLILVCQRSEKLPELIAFCREKRPNAIWPEDADVPHFALKTDQEISDSEIKTYLAWVRKQYNTMRVLSMTQPLSLEATYTDVFLLEKEKYWREEKQESLEKQFAQRENRQQSPERIAGADVLTRSNRLFVVGQPGAGKTTFSKWLALRTTKESDSAQKLPVYVALRRFNTWEGDLLGMLAQELEASGVAEAESKFRSLLQQEKLLLLLDGLDEVQASVRDKLNDQIEDLAKMSESSQIVITCRPYVETRRFQQFDYVQMADFTDEQVSDFIKSWFFEDKAFGDSLLGDLGQENHKSIRELTQAPLLLAILCIAYQENGKFPQKRDELYSRALQVVLAQWDEERGVKRDSNYGQLTVEKKQALLALLAYETFSAGELFIPETRLTQLITAFWREWLQNEIAEQKALYGELKWGELPPKNADAKEVIRELVAQHGLLVEQLPGIYSFSHLTLQEYFTARFVVSNAQVAVPQLMMHVGEDLWREVFLLTAGMLYRADSFSQQYVATLSNLVADDETLIAFLNWAAEKSTSVVTGIGPATSRAFFLFLASAFALSLAMAVFSSHDLIEAIGHTRYLANSLARDITSASRVSDRVKDLVNILARSVRIPYDPISARVRNRDRAHALAFALALDFVVTFDNGLSRDRITVQILQAWSQQQTNLPDWLPDSLMQLNAKEDDRVEFNQLLEQILLRYWGLERIWRFNLEQVILLNRYLTGTQSLMECLRVAIVKDRAAIEAQLLLPPNWRLETGD